MLSDHSSDIAISQGPERIRAATFNVARDSCVLAHNPKDASAPAMPTPMMTGARIVGRLVTSRSKWTPQDALYRAAIRREPERIRLKRLAGIITETAYLEMEQDCALVVIQNVMAIGRCPLRTRVRLPTLWRVCPYFPAAPPEAASQT